MKINKVLEKAFNTYLKMDPESFQPLKELQGQCVQVQLMDFPISFFLLFNSEGIEVLSIFNGEPAAVIKAKSIHLLASAILQNGSKDIHIEGNVEVGYQVYGLFKNVEIDWEEHLSHYIGDVLAHQMGSFTRDFIHKFRVFRGNLRENLTEYLHEEIQWFPPRQELEDFYEDVEALRKKVERLDAYLKLNLEKVQS